jgi:hypothetical protein
VREAFDGLHKILSGVSVDELTPGEASGIVTTMKGIDGVLKVIF